MPTKNVTRPVRADFLWRMVLDRLRRHHQLTAAEIDAWLRDARLVQLPARHKGPFAAALHVTSSAQVEQIESRFRPLLEEALQRATGATHVTLFITNQPLPTPRGPKPGGDAA